MNYLRFAPGDLQAVLDEYAKLKADTSAKDWINTYTGIRFPVLRPQTHHINIRDIARGLATEARYRGQTRRPYNVAEHSVRVSVIVERLAAAAGYPAAIVLLLARKGLLHDASEAYLGDLSAPLKHQVELAGYRKVEALHQAVIFRRFGLSPGEPREIKAVDTILRGSEVDQMVPRRHPDWDPMLPAIRFDGARLGWDWQHAELRFLCRFRQLFPGEVFE